MNSTLNYQSTAYFRVGYELYIGGHNAEVCNPDDGCQVVTITRVWNHEEYEADISNNDIAVVM